MKWPIAGALLVAGLVGCSERAPEGASGASFIVRDLAGIQIIEVPAEAMEAIPRWTLAPEPDSEIGVVEGAARSPDRWVVGAGHLLHVPRNQFGACSD